MPYFSRLTDIVTCNLSSILEQSEDPREVLADVIAEMREGLAAAERSVKTARKNEAAVRAEIDQHQTEADRWLDQARTLIKSGEDAEARNALMRKREVEDLVKGLDQQLAAAEGTREHLTTTWHALTARLSDAQRRLAELTGQPAPADPVPPPELADDETTQEIDAELAALKGELGA